MLDEVIAQAQALPKVKNFFSGMLLPEGFNMPSNILLFCHDFGWPKTIISTRYMLIIPFTEITYIVEDSSYPLHCGQAILVKPYLHRSVPHLHRNYLRLIVSFELSGKQDYLPGEPVMMVSDDAWTLISRLLKHYERKEIIHVAFALTLLLCELAHHTEKSELRDTTTQIKTAMFHINQNLEESLSIKDIAGKVGLSVSHLRRRFREEIGESLGEYIYSRRLSAAQRLLADTSLRVEAIAARCGYDSIYSFSRFFKKNMGISPLLFRKCSKQRTPPWLDTVEASKRETEILNG